MRQHDVELTVVGVEQSEMVAFGLNLEAADDATDEDIKNFAIGFWLDNPEPGFEDYRPFMVRIDGLRA